MMVAATIKQKIKKLTGNKKSGINWNVDKFRNKDTRQKYADEVEKQIEEHENEGIDIEMKWNVLKKCMWQAAEKQIGRKEKQKEREWFNNECKENVAEKNKARITWIKTGKPQDKAEYISKRKMCKAVIKTNKRDWINYQMEQIENERNRNTKMFFQKIDIQKKKHRSKTTNIKNKKGELTEDDEQYKQAWVEHFKELLYDPEISEEEVQYELTNTIIKEPTLEEVKEIINYSHNGKAAGEDSINSEMIKYGGDKLHEEIHKIVKRIWTEEKMPREWEIGQMVTIYKKGDRQLCENYRGITLLCTTYKIISSLIQKMLTTKYSKKISQYQCGFVKGRSTTDAIHTLKQIMEKAHEHKIKIEMLFIDFKQAFDSINRKKLMGILKEKEIDNKLIRLINMTMRDTKINIKTQKGQTEEFPINKGVRQGDALSASLFNIALEHILRKISKGTLRTGGSQIIAYADDVVLITKNRSLMENMLKEIIEEAESIGLRINQDKTKIMKLGNKKKISKKIKIGEHEFEEVKEFTYLGVVVNNTGERKSELNAKIMKANKAFYANKKLLTNNLLSRKTKLTIYKTIIRPILTYGAETLTMTRKEEEELRVEERKILRTILGPIKVSGTNYRSRMNHELLNEMEGEDIVKHIKSQRIKWLGHVWRAGIGTTIREMIEWDPGGKKRQGRPRSKWLKEVEDDLRKIGVVEWRRETEDRKKWKIIAKKARQMS